MKVMVMGRQSGKTTLAVKESADKGWPILCTNLSMLNAVKNIAKKLELEIPEPIFWGSWKYLGKKPLMVIVDNVDVVLSDILGGVKVETAYLQ